MAFALRTVTIKEEGSYFFGEIEPGLIEDLKSWQLLHPAVLGTQMRCIDSNTSEFSCIFATQKDCDQYIIDQETHPIYIKMKKFQEDNNQQAVTTISKV